MPFPVFILATCYSDHEWEVSVAEDGLTIELSSGHGLFECPECGRNARKLDVRPIA